MMWNSKAVIVIDDDMAVELPRNIVTFKLEVRRLGMVQDRVPIGWVRQKTSRSEAKNYFCNCQRDRERTEDRKKFTPPFVTKESQLRWFHIVGQFGGEVKVYSGC